MYHEHKFGDAAKINQSQIDTWRNEILESLKPDEAHWCMRRSGDAFVLGLKGTDGIEIFEVSGGYCWRSYSKEQAAPDVTDEYCEYCDGCGWYEGGKTLQTHCEYCDGTGVKPKTTDEATKSVRNNPK